MYRRDYILQLIERFTQVLIALRNRILAREMSAADVRTELGAIAEQSGLSLDVARRLDVPSLLMWLSASGEIDTGRFWLLAELLYLEGLQARTTGDANAAQVDFERAHALFSRLEPDWTPGPDLASAGDRAADILRMLETRVTPGRA